MVLIHSPDGTNICGSIGGKFEEWSRCTGLKVVKSSYWEKEALPIHLFRHLSCRMYPQCTASVRHGETDRQTDHITMPIADHTACITIS